MAITLLDLSLAFNSNTIGKIHGVSGSRTRNIIPVLTTDSTDDAVEKIGGALDEGEATFMLDYDGSNAGIYNDLNTDFQAGTSAAFTITYSDTSSHAGTAIISSLDIPGAGTADGKVECSVTLAISGKATYTDVAA